MHVASCFTIATPPYDSRHVQGPLASPGPRISAGSGAEGRSPPARPEKLPRRHPDEALGSHVGGKLECSLEDRIATKEAQLFGQQGSLVRPGREGRPDHAAHIRAVAGGRNLVLVQSFDGEKPRFAAV